MSLLLMASHTAPWLGLLAAAVAVITMWRQGKRHLLGASVPARAALAAGFLVLALPDADRWWTMLAVGAVLLGLLLHEVPLRAVAAPRFRVANLVPREARDPGRMMNAVWFANTGLVLAVGLFALASWPTWPLLAGSATALVLSGAVFAGAWDRRRRSRLEHLQVLREAVARIQPTFVLYFSAPRGSEYQALMWLPYLERLGEPFVVVLRESHSLEAISSATRAPVVVCPSLAALDAVMVVPTIRAAFYVNNGMKNGHGVRFAHLTHVQLLHGDSDKASSFNPMTVMYDRVFVAGQAGMDRYAANGVDIPPEKFRIVGRPQVEDVKVSNDRIGDLPGRTVLYAPTWVGFYSDVAYSSLPIGPQIVRGLLDRGATVIFRPHPYAKRDRRSVAQVDEVERVLAADRAGTGRAHLWGAQATQKLGLTDCINRSDAMISDVSAVAVDYLYSLKPFAIADMVGEGEDFVQSFPLARAAYVLQPDGGNIAEVLTDLLERDPLAEMRRQMRAHYLGDFPPERYADAFLDEARRCLEDTPSAGARLPRRDAPDAETLQRS